MKIVAFSDNHGWLPSGLPEGDVLVIAGDILPLDLQRDKIVSLSWIKKRFVKWVNAQSYNKVILVPGNHDFCFEDDVNPFEGMDNIVLLRNELYEYEGVVFYGCPYVAPMRNWAFPAPKGFYKTMPAVDILVCHDTPRIDGAFDEMYIKEFFSRSNRLPGNKELSKEVHKYKYIICGHWHEGTHGGVRYDGGIQYNVSLLDDFYNVTYKPTIIDYSPN